jgi:subtilisin family serine protease
MTSNNPGYTAERNPRPVFRGRRVAKLAAIAALACAAASCESGQEEGTQGLAIQTPDGGGVAPKSSGAGVSSSAPVSVQRQPGEVLVKLRSIQHANSLHSSSLRALSTPGTALDAGSVAVTQTLSRFSVHEAHRLFRGASEPTMQRTFRLRAGGDVDGLIAALGALPEVEYAEPNYVAHSVLTPNDPYFATSGAWGQSFRDLWGLQNINAPTAWNTTQGSGVVVAVVDTGIDYNHPDIAANVWQNPGEVGLDAQGHDKRTNGIDDDNNGQVDDWRGYNFAYLTNDPNDDFGHGTHVAGTIAAIANNGIGIVGVAPQAKVMAVKGLDGSGSGTFAELANAVHYAAFNGARVINASWGALTNAQSQTLLDAIAYAHDTKGAVFVASAGNDASDVGTQGNGFFPASARNAITVSAFTHLDALAYFSNFGEKIDVAAPGGGDTDPTGAIFDPQYSVLSLLAQNANANISQNGQLDIGGSYLRIAGTSMAAPHVSGAAALLFAKFPSWSPEQVRQALRKGATDVGPPGFDFNSGYGRIDAAASLAQPAPLAVHLVAPGATVVGLTQTAVVGTVLGTGLASWQLAWGVGASPTSWTTLTTSTAAVNNATLATWNLGAVPDGLATLHLTATTTDGRSYDDLMAVMIDNVAITSPDPTLVTSFQSGPITLIGTAAPSGFSSYRVDIHGANEGWLTNPAVVLTGGGTQPVRSGTLATWNPSGLPADHYDLHLRVTLTSGTVLEQVVNVIFDPTLHPGWPVSFSALAGGQSGWVELSDLMTAADLDGNGSAELVFGYGTEVTALQSNGTPLPGWPRPINVDNTSALIQRGPAVGDIDGDGHPNVVATNWTGEIYAWKADGSSVPGWPLAVGGSPRVALGDIDGDGTPDVVATNPNGITVFKGNGTTLPGFPRNLEELDAPAIGDLDGDGHNEIVATGVRGGINVWAFNHDGTTRAGFPVHLSTVNVEAHSLAALADIDGDGKLEIIVGAPDGAVHALRSNGTEVAGWPAHGQSTPMNSATIGDLDGDGKLDIFAGNQVIQQGSNVLDFAYAFHGDGTVLSGWPVERIYVPDSEFHFGFGAAAMADVDGDHIAEAIVSSDILLNAPSALHAFKGNGSEAPGFPKPTLAIGMDATSTAVVADVDGDGLMELAFLDGLGEIRLFDLTVPASGTAPWPMFQRDPAHSGCIPVSPSSGGSDAGSCMPQVVSGSTVKQSGNGSVPGPSFSYTVPSVPNALLVVHFDGGSGGTPPTGVTYGGKSMTLLTTTADANSGNQQIWYLVAPAAGANTLAFTTSGNNVPFNLEVETFQGIKPSLPIGAVSSAYNASYSTQYTTSLTTQHPNGLMADFLSFGSGDNPTVTLGSGQTESYYFAASPSDALSSVLPASSPAAHSQSYQFQWSDVYSSISVELVSSCQ